MPPGGVLVGTQPLLDTAKSPMVAPLSLIETEEIESAPAYCPLLLFVMTTGTVAPVVPASWLPKFTLGGTEIAACVAIPESGTLDGVPPPMSRVAERGPGGAEELGWKVIVIWQFFPGAKLGAQELLIVNSPGSVTLTVPIPADEPPIFETVIACDALTVPML